VSRILGKFTRRSSRVGGLFDVKMAEERYDLVDVPYGTEQLVNALLILYVRRYNGVVPEWRSVARTSRGMKSAASTSLQMTLSAAINT